jgi:uncharacterized protein (DUF58 family)
LSGRTGIRQAAVSRLTRWSARRHGRDRLPLTVNRRRIYIIPTRFGLALALLLVAMLLAGLNYNSNLGLAFSFLLVSLGLVVMHHCHRNLLGLAVDANTEVDAFAGGAARFEFSLRNEAAIERCDIEIRCGASAAATVNVPPGSYNQAAVNVAVGQRGVSRLERFELRTRYPFGWFRAWTYVQSPLLAFVAPQPHGDRLLPAAMGTTGIARLSETRGDEEFSGLRAYSAGIPLKHMAWKVLARGGEPAVRSYTGLAAQPEWLDWASLPDLDAETRLSQLCRWVEDSEALQRIYGLRIPGAEIKPSRGRAHRTACLRALAAYPAQAPR